MISLPTGSTVNIRGKTIVEAQNLITKKLSEDSSLRQVYAVLVITQFPPRKVFINGEVKSPQALPIAPGTDMSMASLLTAAGGVLPQADLTRVNVVRTLPNGTRQAQVVDASKFGLPGNNDLGPTLEAGDVVTVPRGAVFILAGEVFKPGVVTRNDVSIASGELPRASRVLYATGGLRPGANRKLIHIIRNAEHGRQTILNVDLDLAGTSSSTVDVSSDPPVKAPKSGNDPDPVLQDGDMVVAGSTGGVIVMGKVRTPGLFPMTAGTTKLSRVIAQAGGFAEFAKSSSVTVTRAGTHQSIKVDVGAIIKDGQLDRDIDLEDGDIVYVGGGVL
jgi:protein involved in polysaccharide export with SLBB domain